MLTEVDISTLPKPYVRDRSNWNFAVQTLSDFVAEDYECAKVTGWPKPIKPATQYKYLCDEARKAKYRGKVKVRMVNDDIYLIWVGEYDE